MINKLNYIIITLFGIGKLKKIPGTYASLSTTIFLFFLLHVFYFSQNLILLLILITFFYSLYGINNYIKNLDNKDPKEVVIDEFIGQSIPIYIYEISHGTVKSFNDAIIFYIIIFFLFRFFDIMKPFPVNYFDKKHKNSFGVIMDDVMAGLYVVLVLIFFMVIKKLIF